VSEQPPARRADVIGPGIAVLMVVVGLLGLGKWQLDRKVWKEDLIATLEQRLAAAPSELPPPARWADLTAAGDEFRRVRFTAEFVSGSEALVFTSGSTFRPDVSGPGYWVFAPVRLPGGTIVVDRGFLPEGQQDRAGHFRGSLEMVGVMRWPELPGWFTPQADPSHNLWFVRDPQSMAQAKGWGEVAPFYIELESPLPPSGLPLPGPLKVNLPDDHLQYALTWFGLAAVVAISFAAWLRSRWVTSPQSSR
jgi:cytochrome oxidase assembly protein ShyY1